jgi:hypothetical protein
VLATLDEVCFFEAEVGVTCGLIHCLAPSVDKQGLRRDTPETDRGGLYGSVYIINIKLLLLKPYR